MDDTAFGTSSRCAGTQRTTMAPTITPRMAKKNVLVIRASATKAPGDVVDSRLQMVHQVMEHATKFVLRRPQDVTAANRHHPDPGRVDNHPGHRLDERRPEDPEDGAVQDAGRAAGIVHLHDEADERRTPAP